MKGCGLVLWCTVAVGIPEVVRVLCVRALGSLHSFGPPKPHFGWDMSDQDLCTTVSSQLLVKLNPTCLILGGLEDVQSETQETLNLQNRDFTTNKSLGNLLQLAKPVKSRKP